MDGRNESPAEDGPVGLARFWLGQLLAGMGISARIEVLRREGQTVLNALCGADGPHAIGRKGRTLEAVELLVRRILEQRYPGEGTCVGIDVEDYRERRRRNLRHLARRTAEQVREHGEPVTLGPLDPRDRHTIHAALREESNVTAASHGDGWIKNIVITPIEG